jgi:bacterial/archaeal transporter family-2 protein
VAVAVRARVGLPTLGGVSAGLGLAVQSYINGRLGRTIGSGEVAALVNNSTGLAIVAVIAVASGAVPRALRRLRRVRGWYLLGGLGGAMVVTAGALGAPVLGVALLSIAFVCGQTTGSLVADRLGLSPAGRHDATPARLAGAALAIAAVGVSAIGARHGMHVGLLLLATAAGVGIAFQQAANGHLARATGEPLFACIVNFVVGIAVLVVIAAIVTGLAPPKGWSGSPLLYCGGVLGAYIAVMLTIVVSRLGILRLMLAVTAGQAAGGLAVDLAAPAHGRAVTAVTVIGVALAFAAVLVTARDHP